MKNKIVATALMLLISGSAFFYCSFHSREIPQGFAPIDVVYHGLKTADIKVLEPRNTHIRNENEGPVVCNAPQI